ncbi:MAG: hypothetical protein H7839_23605 [Magnetococcus sp. YQC-5]
MKKDLLVLTADADAEAIMNAIMPRYQSIGMREICFDVKRHPMHDSGLFKDGPELTRLFKNQYEYLIIILDYHGSGCNSDVQKCSQNLQARLDDVTWSSHSFSSIIVPEIEEWLWHNIESICNFFHIDGSELQKIIQVYCNQKKLGDFSLARTNHPKEFIDYLSYVKLRKNHLLPREYRMIAERASLADWQNSSSFNHLVSQLRAWFPANRGAGSAES